MTLKDFIRINMVDYVNPKQFELNSETLKAITNRETATHRFNDLANKLKSKMGKEKWESFCKNNNYSPTVVGVSDPLVNAGIPIRKEEFSRIVSESLEYYYTKIEEEIKKEDPSFSMDGFIDESMKIIDQTLMKPEDVEYKPLEKDVNGILDKMKTIYGDNSEKYNEVKELLTFANENIKKSDLNSPSLDTNNDGMAVRIKGKLSSEAFTKDNAPILQVANFQRNEFQGVKTDGTLNIKNDFINNQEAIDYVKNAKLVLSPEYKDFLRKNIPLFIENNILSKGEESTKNYGFKEYAKSRNSVLDGVKQINDNENLSREEADKFVKTLKEFKKQVNTLDNLLDITKKGLGSSFITSGNIDVVRNKTIPVKYRFDINTSSHFNGLSYIAQFIKDNDINLEEFLEDPYKFDNKIYKEEHEFKDILNKRFKAENSKVSLLKNWADDMTFFTVHMNNMNDYRPFEALTMLEPNEEYRKKGIVEHVKRMDALGVAFAKYSSDIACGNIFKNPDYHDQVSDLMANVLVLDQKDLNYDNMASGIFKDPNTLEYDKKFDRRKYIEGKNNLPFEEYKNNFMMEIVNIINDFGDDGGIDETLIDKNLVLLSAQKAAVDILKARHLENKSPEFAALLEFVKNPYGEIDMYYDELTYDIDKDQVTEEKMMKFANSEAVKEVELEIEIDKEFADVFENFSKEAYENKFEEFIVNKMASLPKDERTERNLAVLLKRTDKVMKEEVFKKNGLNYEKELVNGGKSKEDLTRLSRKVVSAYGAIKEAKGKVTRALNDDKTPKDEKLFKSAASLSYLEKQHKDRPFSFFHIPSYFREWKAIKDIKSQIQDAGFTKEALENAQRAIGNIPALMVAFNGSKMASKLYADARRDCLLEYQNHKKDIARQYNLEELNENLHKNLENDSKEIDNAPKSQQINEISKIKVREFDAPNNQELNGPK